MKSILYISLLSFLFFACKKQNLIITKKYNLEAFDTLVLNNAYDVEIIQGNINQLEISGTNKMLSNNIYEIENNTLTIQNDKKLKWINPKHNKIQLKITIDGINKIVANETCKIHSSNTIIGNEIGIVLKSKLNQAEIKVDCNTFYYWNNFPCGGNLKVSGNCKELKIWNTALLKVDASELSTPYAYIENSSKGDCKINAPQTLEYKLLGEGNIRLRAMPNYLVALDTTGRGQLIIE